MMKMIVEDTIFENGANLKVIGVGGCGGNAVQNMIESKMEGVVFICANTDAQDLGKSTADIKIPLGQKLMNGRGAGSKPDVGRNACLENKDQIKDTLNNTEMVFLTAGMGGGTGTGASPVIAEIAKEKNILTVAIVTTPFKFEGRARMKIALQGIKELKKNVDSIIVVPNEKLLSELSDDITDLDAFRESDSVLKGAVQGIADIISSPGKINTDFEDVKSIMEAAGKAMMGTGVASGANAAQEAASLAINSRLLDDVNMKEAKGLLINITASSELSLMEVAKAYEYIGSSAADDATIITGRVVDDSLGDKVKVTVIATGLADNSKEEKEEKKEEEKPHVVESKESPNEPTKYHAEVKATYGIEKDKDKKEITSTPPPVVSDEDLRKGLDFLDIPAFLRNQNN